MDNVGPVTRDHHGLQFNENHNRRYLENRTASVADTSRSTFCFRSPILTLGPSLKICQLNIEGISKDKSDYLSKICIDYGIDVIALQETHTATEEQLRTRGSIDGYHLVDFLCSGVHGIATYVKDSITNFEKVYAQIISDIYLITIKVSDVHIVNVYKPPNVQWPHDFDTASPHPAVYIGDFNCHHVQWLYDSSDQNGISLQEWMEINNLHLVFDAKDNKTFHSARWNRDYNPDLCIVSMDNDYKPLQTSRKVLKSFPRSQHRPSILNIGVQIPLVSSIPKPRWNFQKANWSKFSKLVDSTLR